MKLACWLCGRPAVLGVSARDSSTQLKEYKYSISGVGKLQPGGQMRPVKLFNRDRRT